MRYCVVNLGKRLSNLPQVKKQKHMYTTMTGVVPIMLAFRGGDDLDLDSLDIYSSSAQVDVTLQKQGKS